MNDFPDDLEFDPAKGEDEASDPDTNLILDYLSNKLDPGEVERLEDRARQDKAFRYKLADIVLLKGLVMLALEKNPSPAARECRKTQRLFLDYLKGRTSVKKTAQLSRHLEECFECELAFERFQEQPEAAAKADRGGWGGFWRRLVRPGRQLAVAAIVVVALAAGAFGIVGFLTSAGRSGSHGAPASGDSAQPDGLVLRPSEVLGALQEILDAQPGLAADHKLSDLVKEILDGTRSPVERADRYTRLAKEFGPKVEHLLWVLAANEPIEHARDQLYRSIDSPSIADFPGLIAAARREVASRNDLAFVLAEFLAAHLNDDVRAYLRSLFAEGEPRNDAWWAMLFRQIYGPMKQDPVIEWRMTRLLRDPNDQVRSFAVVAGAEAGKDEVMPIAVELLKSNDFTTQVNAVRAITRRGTKADVDRLLAQPWAGGPAMKPLIDSLLRARKDIALPHNP